MTSIVQEVADRTIRLTPDDVSADAAAQIAMVGLARIHALQRHFGQEPDAMLFIGPDATPSCNSARSRAGFANGTRYWWSSDQPFLPVGFGPNGCGLCVVGLPDQPRPNDLQRALFSLCSSPPSVGDLPIQLDFGRRNHFLGVFSVTTTPTFDFPYVAILHCSAPELNPNGTVASGYIKTFQTPIGSVAYVAEDSLDSYWDAYTTLRDFSRTKREVIAETLFPAGQILSNRSHQGFSSRCEICIGSHDVDQDSHYVFLGGMSSSSYLYEPGPRRPTMLGAGRVLPHGAGSSYDFASDAVVSLDERGEIEIELRRGDFRMALRHMGDLPYAYRPDVIFSRLVDDEYCSPMARLTPTQTLRT